MSDQLSRIHVLAEKPIDSNVIDQIVEKLCPDSMTASIPPNVTTEIANIPYNDVEPYIYAKLYKAGFHDQTFFENQVKYEEGSAYGIRICILKIYADKGRNIVI